jgi:YfiH family protein
VKIQETNLLLSLLDKETAKGKLVCAFSRRALGNMSLFYGNTANILKNRKKFLSSLGIDYRSLVCARQIHGSNAGYVQEKDKGRGALSYEEAIAETDALVTNAKNLPLAIFTADCLTLFLYDPITESIGLVHAGWRSTRFEITKKTIQLMQDKFNSQVKDLYAGFGPAIRECCYQVGKEFNESFSGYLKEKGNHYYLDLVGINKKQLLESGVEVAHIIDSWICTSCRNKDFFSYRRQNNCGRMMSVIMLR